MLYFGITQFFFFFIIFRRMEEKKVKLTTIARIFTHVVCRLKTQLPSRPNASWRVLRFPL